MQVIPNSHLWIHLDGLIFSLQHDIEWHATRKEREKRIKNSKHTIIDMHEPLTKEYVLVGLRNAIKHKYELAFDPMTMKEVPNAFYFRRVEDMITHLEGREDWDKEDFLDLIIATKNNGFDLKCERKMERTDVYKRLDTERDYQDLRWSTRRDENGTPDAEKPPAEWINYMEYHLAAAKEAVYHLKTEEALAQVRKVAALGVRCLELHGCPERKIPAELENKA